jgi:hypothetical protein
MGFYRTNMNRFFKYSIVWMGMLCWLSGCNSSTKPVSDASKCSGPQIKGVCIASYSHQNASLYITEQSHLFCPGMKNLQIQSNEPEGRLLRQLNYNNYILSGSPESSIQDQHLDKMMSIAVFNSMAWAVELLPESVKSPNEAIKIEGQWYLPFVITDAQITITLLKSNDTEKNSLVKIQDDKTTLLAESYDYWFNKRLQKNIPHTIDVFDMTKGLSSKKLILQLQYTDVTVRD